MVDIKDVGELGEPEGHEYDGEEGLGLRGRHGCALGCTQETTNLKDLLANLTGR